ncbi:hypothetical protein V6259_12795 [Marinomonas sp. TI.3.20]|uniref:hypothetical protein n=1 Tax=Marinomonas sp. TI.3.20 TaxID=3121296 RepID=UPI00311E05B4
MKKLELTTTSQPSEKNTLLTDQYRSGQLSEVAIRALKGAETLTDTNKQYESHYRIFTRWLSSKGFSGSLSTISYIEIINFLAEQAEGTRTVYEKGSGLLLDGHSIAVATLKSRIWGLYKMLEFKHGLIFKEQDQKRITEFLKLLQLNPERANKSGRKQGQAYPLRWIDIEAMLKSDYIHSASKLVVSRDRALLSFLAVTGCRESEALGKYGIRIKDLTVHDDRIDYQRVVLKNGKRTHDFRGSLMKTDLGPACPFEAIKNHLALMIREPLCNPDTKLFPRVNRNGEAYITGTPKSIAHLGAAIVDSWLRDLALNIGLPMDKIKRISGHSVRMGLVVDQVEKGKSLKYISSITGQSIGTVERYSKQADLGGFQAGA